MLDAAYLIPAFPLVGFALLCLVGARLKEPLAGWVATLMAGGAFLCAAVTYAGLRSRHNRELGAHTRVVFDWIPSLHVKIALNIDPLSITMALFVTGVGSLIHLYAIGYMHGDERFARFFVYLNLFLLSMVMLVMGDSFLVLFLGWEGVGACSYLLVSFWFEKPAPPSAGKKAFIVNRVGDVGFMIAMFLIFKNVGSLTFHDVFAFHFGPYTATAIVVCTFLGCAGKSAQLPLYIWLPDAMEGPTPVSALIHAATMVTAGVYLLCRISPITAQAYHWAPLMIAWVGALTALFAATIACAQDDIKKVLAYSTISQLGYMFLAVGVGAYTSGVFHMITHAFFKALLFLGAGSVIHGLHEQQDMKRMGRLLKYMPVTGYTFIVAWLAIAGVPPFAGFWSKDDILLAAWHQNRGLWLVGLVAALLTAYYMSRQVQLVFFGTERFREEAHPAHPVETGAEGGEQGQLTSPEPVAGTGQEPQAHQPETHDTEGSDPVHATEGSDPVHAGVGHDPVHATEGHDPVHAGVGHGPAHADHAALPHESPWTMTLPLVSLAVLAAVGGVLDLPFGGRFGDLLGRWLEPAIAPLPHASASTSGRWTLVLVATVVALAGVALGLRAWLPSAEQPQLEPEILQDAWGYDRAVTTFMGGPGRQLADGAAWFDSHVIDGTAMGIGRLVQSGGTQLRKLQTGYVRNYALGIAAGVVVLFAYTLVVR